MDHGRTGTRYRLLVPTPGSGALTNALVNVFVAVIACMALFGFTALSMRSLREATSRDAVLRRLLRAPSADDLARGRVWGPVTLRTSDAGPLCYVEHQRYIRGKNGGWRTDAWAWSGASPTVDLGRMTYRLDLHAIDFDPRDAEVEANEAPHRARINFEPGGRLRTQCLQDGEPAFGDLCVSGADAGRCGDGSPSVLTAGHGRPTARIRDHASNAAAGLTAALLVASLLALYGWRAARAGAIVDALGAWSPTPPPGPRLATWIGLGVGTVAAFVLCVSFADETPGVRLYVGGYAFGIVALGAVAAALVLAYDRRRRVVRAIEPVEAAETSRLARVGEGMAELAVRVPADAPTVSFPGLPPCAFVSVDVKRMVYVGRNQRAEPLHAAAWPATVPVEDPTGTGLLDLTDATLDLRAVFFHAAGREAVALLQQLGATPFGWTGAEGDPNLSLEVAVSYLEPGEHLYLLGSIRRVEDPTAPASYRAMGTLPVIAATDEKHLAVHAGREATLLRGLSLERGYLAVAMGVVGGLGASLVGALVWLASRA